MKTLIIGKGKVGQATAQTLKTPVDFHDPYKGIVVTDFDCYDLIIVCVDSLQKNAHDHKDNEAVLDMLTAEDYKGIVALRSTVSPAFVQLWEQKYSLRFIMFPEFMKQTDDLKMDTPWIVVLGGPENEVKWMREYLLKYQYCSDPSMYHLTSRVESAIIKLCQNAGLGVKVIFYNMVHDICKKFGASYDLVRHGVGADSRVGYQHSIVPSPDDGMQGFGGHCLPKDIRCLSSIETEHGFFTKLLEINKMLGR